MTWLPPWTVYFRNVTCRPCSQLPSQKRRKLLEIWKLSSRRHQISQFWWFSIRAVCALRKTGTWRNIRNDSELVRSNPALKPLGWMYRDSVCYVWCSSVYRGVVSQRAVSDHHPLHMSIAPVQIVRFPVEHDEFNSARHPFQVFRHSPFLHIPHPDVFGPVTKQRISILARKWALLP